MAAAPERHAPGGARLAVILIGHGAPALDCPPQLVGELMSLEWRADGGGHHHDGSERTPATRPAASPGGLAQDVAPQDGPAGRHARAEELDRRIRDWPRHAGNDPYKRGLEQMAAALKPLLPTDLFAIGYNEFCRPSIPEAIATMVERGATRVLVVPTMLTPGGVHSEIDIPRALEAARRTHPGVSIEYVWPFAVEEVAKLLAAHVARIPKSTLA
jgi:sirohydrochlorin cobaltochelatase